MTARRRLLLLGAGVLAANVAVFIPLAIVANLPAQFGGVGTDAGEEFLTRGTAISAPLVTLVALAGFLVLLRQDGRRATIGVVGTGSIGVLFFIGALGEAFAAGTPDVSKAVLVASGIGVGALAVGMIGLAIAALLELRRP